MCCYQFIYLNVACPSDRCYFMAYHGILMFTNIWLSVLSFLHPIEINNVELRILILNSGNSFMITSVSFQYPDVSKWSFVLM